MLEAFKELPPENFNPPTSSQVSKEILKGNWLIQGSGYSTTPLPYSSDEEEDENGEPKDLPEEIPASSALSVHSILHWVNKNDPRGPIPTNPSEDPQYARWEYAVQAWAENHLQSYWQTNFVPDPSDEEEGGQVEQ